MQIKATVEFDSGRAGQRTLADFELNTPASEVNRDGGNLIATWQNAPDALVESILREFNEGDTIMEVHLAKEE